MKYNRTIRTWTEYLVLLILISGCSYSGREIIDSDIIGQEINESDAAKDEAEHNAISFMEQTEDEQIIYNQVKKIDFTLVEHLINTEVYDSKMDREYKESFLNFIFNKEAVEYSGYQAGEMVDCYYDCLYDIGAYIEEGFLETMVNEAEYWYLDFDGDGMPELVFELPGSKVNPIILKYDSIKKCAYLFLAGDSRDWHFLCPGNLYYDISTKVGVTRYGLKRYDISGNETTKLIFSVLYEYDPWKYRIWYHSVENPDNIIDIGAEVDEEIWNELTKEFFYAIDHKSSGMSFIDIFDDMASPYINEFVENSTNAVQD